MYWRGGQPIFKQGFRELEDELGELLLDEDGGLDELLEGLDGLLEDEGLEGLLEERALDDELMPELEEILEPED